MAQNKGSPRAAKIYECLSVYIVDMAAFAAFKKNGWSLDAFKCPNRAVYAAWKIGFGSFKKFAAAGAGECIRSGVVALFHGAKVGRMGGDSVLPDGKDLVKISRRGARRNISQRRRGAETQS
jgi:hypothetical protein